MSHPSTAARLAIPVRSGLAVAAGLLLAGGALAGCGGSKAAAGQAAAQASATGSQQGRCRIRRQCPAAFGTLAEIDGHVLQVQNQATGQVSVSYSTSTTFSQTRTVTAAAAEGRHLRDGGRPAQPSPAARRRRLAEPTRPAFRRPACRSRPRSTAVARSPAWRPRPVASVRPAERLAVRPAERLSVRPAERPAVRPGRRLRRIRHRQGERRQRGTPDRADAGARPAGGQTVTVTLTASTTYTETVPATAAALRVGECVRPPARRAPPERSRRPGSRSARPARTAAPPAASAADRQPARPRPVPDMTGRTAVGWAGVGCCWSAPCWRSGWSRRA